MRERYDLVVVGMGSGGIVAAKLAARIGWRVAACERGRIGGDCLWTGCIPSKALLAAAKAAHAMRTAGRFGIAPVEPRVDGAAVWERIRAVQEEIAQTDDDPAAFERTGVELVDGTARLTGRNTVETDGQLLETRYILVATGSRPAIPSLEGLAGAGFLTNETIFALERLPRTLVVLGGGPVGVELAQALARLGVTVTLLQRAERLLTRDPPELTDALARALEADGVDVRLGVELTRVTADSTVKYVHGRIGGSERTFAAEEILVATGRRPNVEGLGLRAAGVALGPRGIIVDARLRTSVRSIYAAGDVAGRFRFTHSAAHEAATAVRNMAFPGWSRAPALVPWCTFTDPELAHVGLTEAQARERFGDRRVRVRTLLLTDSDRARAERATRGEVRLVEARGRLVGAHVLAPSAGETIHELTAAVGRRARLLRAGRMVHVYPTISTAVGTLAAEHAFELAARFRWLTRLRVR